MQADTSPRSEPSNREKDDFRVLALLSAYNEEDIIGPVLAHLIENGIEVYFLDNDSTDGTVQEAERWLGRGVIRIEQFPAERSGGRSAFDWGAILRRKEELASELSADWFIHHDADEIRESPWPGVSLRDAIRWVDRLGYNCIDFRVVNFPPIDNGFRRGDDPRTYFRYWEQPGEFDEVQIKAWKKGFPPISLFPFGGHEVRFRDRRVFPIRFLLRHYPIRSQQHGERKVFAERRDRFLGAERAKGWHVQYDSWKEGDSFLAEPYRLNLFDDDRVRLDLLLENETAREAAGRAERLTEEVERLQEEQRRLEERLRTAEEVRSRFELDVSKRERSTEELTRLLGAHEGRAAELERQLERQLDLGRRALEIQARLSESAALVKTLSARLDASRARADDLAASRPALEAHAARLEQENARLSGALERLRTSTIWRWTSPLRRFLDAVKKSGRLSAPSPGRPLGD
jgi:glycosyltransferase involved in cell wall biosynthesis